MTKKALLLALFIPACAAEGAVAPTGGAKHELQNNPAPMFALESVNGKGKVDLAKWKGKVVLVDFWATWCEPCKKAFPKLEELRVKYEASGVSVVAVSEDDEADGIAAFGTTYRAKFPLVWDQNKSVAGKWKPKTMPSSFIVDKMGVVRFVHVGYDEQAGREIETELKSLL